MIVRLSYHAEDCDKDKDDDFSFKSKTEADQGLCNPICCRRPCFAAQLWQRRQPPTGVGRKSTTARLSLGVFLFFSCLLASFDQFAVFKTRVCHTSSTVFFQTMWIVG